MKSCHYCRKRITKRGQTFDHKTPIARGGSVNDPLNLCICCQPCNNMKDDMTEAEFLVYTNAFGFKKIKQYYEAKQCIILEKPFPQHILGSEQSSPAILPRSQARVSL